MNAAVILNGCGHLDGSEIHESVCAMLALQTEGFAVHVYSLNCQTVTIDHITGKSCENESRSALIESARIARGDVRPLNEMNVKRYHALIIPGGFGVAKNMCNFSSKGSSMTVSEDIKSIILKFYGEKKVIGAICIAPILVANVLRNFNISITFGDDKTAASARHTVLKWGVQHLACERDQCVVDKENRIVTTPAYMYGDSQITHIFGGISKLAQAIKELVIAKHQI